MTMVVRKAWPDGPRRDLQGVEAMNETGTVSPDDVLAVAAACRRALEQFAGADWEGPAGDRDLRSLPKVDLHVHLEGSVRPDTLAEIACANGAPLPDGLQEGRWTFADFDDFIRNWTAAYRCMRKAGDFERIAYEFVEDEAAQGVRYVEVTFSVPDHGLALGEWEMPLEAALLGLARGEADFGVRWGVVVDVVRGYPLDASERAMQVAVKFRERGVVALGLGGNERFPPSDYERIFRAGREAGLRSVPHAGETRGPESIRGAVRALVADRIGHGIRVLEDDDLVAELRGLGTALEVCPTSNVRTGVVRSLAEHPLPRLIEAGLAVTLNSDDPGMFTSPLLGEYALAREVFGLNDAAIADVARAGLRASFAMDEIKGALEARIEDWLIT